ncbi:signal peptide peptidase SppA [Pyrococcus furiosus DSM 3638]|uniref:Signal peptide peptidase SppA n=3 Tax=Pyrococcus furiosus TaxID=2261 RepID=A0A5C0XPN4_PYRFU|nr:MULTISPECIES: signal peptide peptidase SppA [Pyrococcus]AAL81707.1 protease iv [Pyrococcus furiosus DSM 3638]AFN04365.1 endopeptidase IV [Pyrococcus furiosus COM1]MDK2869703.1 protease [Pyrococcus sp.]QEK79206.1 signal peptide peptidase SppA [Pyrococcus furiosus DSM 3638]
MPEGVWKYISFILALVLSFSIAANALLYLQVGELQSTTYKLQKILPSQTNITTNYTTLQLKIEELKKEIEYLRAYIQKQNETANGSLAIVPIFGLIDENMALEVVKKLEVIKSDPSIRGVLLWIDSPGGYIGPVRAIYKEVKELAYIKPIVAYISGYATSGGYYIACGADKIIADPYAQVGSIGVIYVHFNAQKYYEMNGIEVEVFKTGPYKDMGADWRGLKPEEREIIQKQIDVYFKTFLDVVMEGRNLNETKVKEYADGRAWFAYEVNGTLIDDIGDLQYAIEETKKLANLKSANIVIFDVKPSNFEIRGSSALYLPQEYVYKYIRR